MNEYLRQDVDEDLRQDVYEDLRKMLKLRYPDEMKNSLLSIPFFIREEKGKLTAEVNFGSSKKAYFEYQNNTWYCTRDWRD